MTGGFPVLGSAARITNAGPENFTALIAGGSGSGAPSATNTKGAWVSLGTTSHDASAILLQILVGAGGATSDVGPVAAIDLAVGATGSEVVIVADLVHWQVSDASPVYPIITYLLPVPVPSGTQLNARCQLDSSIGSTGLYLYVYPTLLDGGFTQSQAGAIDTIGFNETTTCGTVLTPGGGAGTYGSYVQLIASTAHDYIGFLAAVNINNNADGDYFWDLAIGAAGSEVTLLPAMYFRYHAQTARVWPFMPIPIPAGSRLAGRVWAGNTQAIGLTIYGVR